MELCGLKAQASGLCHHSPVVMRFENQNRYKQYTPQEGTRPFLPVLMVKTDYDRAGLADEYI